MVLLNVGSLQTEGLLIHFSEVVLIDWTVLRLI